MDQPANVRIDKWLWAARLFKTRSMAIAACQAGHVKIEDQRVKPARTLRVGEVLSVQVGEITRTVKVVGLLERRVGAAVLKDYLEDLTPASEYQKQKEQRQAAVLQRPRGAGRPTKRDRRVLEQMGFGRFAPGESAER